MLVIVNITVVDLLLRREEKLPFTYLFLSLLAEGAGVVDSGLGFGRVLHASRAPDWGVVDFLFGVVSVGNVYIEILLATRFSAGASYRRQSRVVAWLSVRGGNLRKRGRLCVSNSCTRCHGKDGDSTCSYFYLYKTKTQ